MMKRILVGLFVLTPSLHADWIDDLVTVVKDGKIEQVKALTMIQQHVDTDQKEIDRLEKILEANDEDGFWATIRGGTYQVQWAAAKTSLRYHKKVQTFIKGLPKNDRDRKSLINHLTQLKLYQEELQELKEAYADSSGWVDSAKAGSLVAAKELQIKSRKALIKSSFIF